VTTYDKAEQGDNYAENTHRDCTGQGLQKTLPKFYQMENALANPPSWVEAEEVPVPPSSAVETRNWPAELC
jgi:hypothetical protein